MAIYLIGTVHVDPQISSRLEQALDLLKPQTIFVEGCSKMQSFIDATRAKAKQSIDEAFVKCEWTEETKNKVKNSIFGPDLSIAEFSAVREYASKRGIYWHGLDTNEFIALVCDAVLSLIPPFCKYIIKKFSEADAQKELADMHGKDMPNIEALYHQFDNPEKKATLSAVPFEMLGERDQQWEQIIRKEYQKNPDANIAVIAGHAHIMELGNRTLYDRIKDLKPKRAILPEATKGNYREQEL